MGESKPRLNAVKLTMEQRREAEDLSMLVVDDPEAAAYELVALRAEAEGLRSSQRDHEEDCACLPEDRSVTETVSSLRTQLSEAEQQIGRLEGRLEFQGRELSRYREALEKLHKQAELACDEAENERGHRQPMLWADYVIEVCAQALSDAGGGHPCQCICHDDGGTNVGHGCEDCHDSHHSTGEKS